MLASALRSVRPLAGRLPAAAMALLCSATLAAPLQAAPIRNATVQQNIDRHLALERARHGDWSALRRDRPRSRAEQWSLDRARMAGRSLAERGALSRAPGGPIVEGGGPPTALYVTFDDTRAVSEGYLAKFDPAGLPAAGWPAFGLQVIASGQIAYFHRSVDDGAGGRVVGWLESAIGVARLRTQRINQSGTRLWGAAGTMVSPNYDADLAWDMIPDGAGGVFFAWEATAAGERFIRVQHVNGAGGIPAGWPAAGVVLSVPGAMPTTPHLARDGVGGAYVTWIEAFDGLVYAQHLDASANPQFSPAEGRPFSFVSNQYAISPDASSGLTLTWSAYRDFGLEVFAERLDTGGTPTWGDSGIIVSQAPENQSEPRIQPDDSGGVLIGWFDGRAARNEVYAMRLDSNGIPAAGWPANGARVGLTDQFEIGWISDGLNGAFFALSLWDPGTGRSNLTMQHLLSDGGIANNYGADGVPTGGNAGGIDPVTLVLDGGGGVMAGWLEFDHLGPVLFGQRIDIGGALAWGGGNPLRLSPSSIGRQGLPSLIEGGSGGARVGFEQYNGPGAQFDAGFKRVNQNGAPQGSTIPVAYGPDVAEGITLIPDGANQVIALWASSTSSSTDLYAQRYSNMGAPLWTPGGIAINTGVTFYGYYGYRFAATSDGASGAILGWNETDATVQRIDSTGTARWGPTGTTAFTGIHASGLTSDRSLQPADANGAFVTGIVVDDVARWCVQKLDGDGNRLWGTNGYELLNDSLGIAPDFDSIITPDGQGGVYAAWQVGVFPDDPIHTIRMVRITAAGVLAPGWPTLGVEVRGGFESGLLSSLAPDGLGNAVATWMEFRGGRIGAYAQLVNASGGLQWNGPGPNTTTNGTVANEGVALALDSGAQVFPLVDTDGAGGAVFAWLDGRGSSWDVYAQRITSSGTRAWGSTGLAVCTAVGPQSDLTLVSDGANGALIAWADGRTMPADLIEIARVTGAGALPWTSNGVVSTLASLQSAQVVDGIARLAWTTSDPQFRARLERRTQHSAWQTLTDVRVDGTGWIRAEDATIERGVRYGYRLVTTSAGLEQPLDEVWLDVPNTLSFALLGVRPNPANGPLTVSFALPKAAPARLEVMDVAGRRVYSREVGSLGAGSHVLNLGEPSGMGPGLYFLRLTQGHDQREVRFTRVR